MRLDRASYEVLRYSRIEGAAAGAPAAIRGESASCSGRPMVAAVVLRHDLDVLEADLAVGIFILDSQIGEMHLVVEVRQVVLTRPSRYLGIAPVRTAVAVAIAAIALLEKA